MAASVRRLLASCLCLFAVAGSMAVQPGVRADERSWQVLAGGGVGGVELAAPMDVAIDGAAPAP